MTGAVFFYQAAIVGTVWWFTSHYGWLGYMLTMIFWVVFTFSRVQTIHLTVLQVTVLFATGYIMWEPAHASLQRTFESAGIWIIACISIVAIVIFIKIFRWISAIFYANMSNFIFNVRKFLASPSLDHVKDVAKNSALSACGISDVLDTDGPVYLNVPYHEKEEAKALGARWDPHRRSWYAPRGYELALNRWIPKKDIKKEEANV